MWVYETIVINFSANLTQFSWSPKTFFISMSIYDTHGSMATRTTKETYWQILSMSCLVERINIFCCSGCGSTYEARSPKIELSPKYMSTFSPNYNNDTIRLSTESFTSSVAENREHMVS